MPHRHSIVMGAAESGARVAPLAGPPPPSSPAMRPILPTVLAAAVAALAAAPCTAAAQKALATSSNGSGAYCVSTSGTTALTGTCDRSYEVFRTEWTTSSRPSGVIRIYKNDGTCLDASGGPGQAVRTRRCDGSLAQGWTIHPAGQIESQQHGGQCLDVYGGIGHHRTVGLHGCDYAQPDTRRRDNQRFVFGAVRPRSSVSASTAAPLSQILVNGMVVNGRGGNVVAAGGANAVAAGGANVVAAGGANVVAAGGGN